MAKKKTKKKTSVAPVSDTLDTPEPLLPGIVEDDTRVKGLINIIEDIKQYDLGDMDERFNKAMDKLAYAIGSVANRLAKALEVQAKDVASKKARKAKLLDAAEKLGV